MTKRKREQDLTIDGKPVVGASKAAQILTRRAKEMGYDRRYSRDTIYRHYVEGTLKAAMETPSGNLYFAEDVEKLPINPNIGRSNKSKPNGGESLPTAA